MKHRGVQTGIGLLLGVVLAVLLISPLAPRKTEAAVVIVASLVLDAVTCNVNVFFYGCGGGGAPASGTSSGASGSCGSGVTLNTNTPSSGGLSLNIVSQASGLKKTVGPAANCTSCNNGATNPPTCNACPSGYVYIAPNCVIKPKISSFTISPSTIDAGASATISWSADSKNTSSCTATGGFSTGGALSGNVTVTPAQTQTYQITCTNSGGASSSASATVTVLNPKIDAFSISPLRVAKGGSATATWKATDVKSCAVTGPGLSASGLSGSATATNITHQSTYTLSCTTLDKPLTQSVIVNVVPTFGQF